eukprot:6187658-Pleurochrysis_carterae.AAC.1
MFEEAVEHGQNWHEFSLIAKARSKQGSREVGNLQLPKSQPNATRLKHACSHAYDDGGIESHKRLKAFYSDFPRFLQMSRTSYTQPCFQFPAESFGMLHSLLRVPISTWLMLQLHKSSRVSARLEVRAGYTLPAGRARLR